MKYRDIFQHRVSFKKEWKGSYPVKTIKKEKWTFHCVTCGKPILSPLGGKTMFCKLKSAVSAKENVTQHTFGDVQHQSQ